MSIIVRLWTKDHEDEPYSLIGTRRVNGPEELKYLEEHYDVEWVGIADDQVENSSTRTEGRS